MSEIVCAIEGHVEGVSAATLLSEAYGALNTGWTDSEWVKVSAQLRYFVTWRCII